MSFIAYLIALIFAAGAALFGLDVITAPLPPSGQALHGAGTVSGNKLARRESDQQQRNNGGHPGALTPIFPAHPGEKDAHDELATQSTQAQPGQPQHMQGLTARETVAVRPSPLQADQTANDPELHSILQPNVKAVENFSDRTAAQASAKPTSQQQAPADTSQQQVSVRPATGSCDIEACMRSYRSFRAADCTYQPYEGPRRACVTPHEGQRGAARTSPPPSREVATQAKNGAEKAYNNDDGDRDDGRTNVSAAQVYGDDATDYDNSNDAYDEDDDTDAYASAPHDVVIIRQPPWFR